MIQRRHLSRLLAVLLLLAVVLLVGCNPAARQSTFDTAGPVARMQLNLFWVVLWAAVFVFVVVEGILLFAILRFRRRARQEGAPPQTHGHTRLEVAWTVAPAIVLLVVAIPTISTAFSVANPPSTPDLEVRVVGHQWWWEFQYPSLGVVTANELHIPVGKVVKLNLESVDVIHSFWVPNLAGKMDVIPNRLNNMWLKAERAENYLGQCAEFCGIAHALMRLRVIAEPEEEFQAWVQAHKVTPSPPATEKEQEGFALFTGKGGCLACHTVEGTVAQGKVGPNLTHVARRTTLAAGLLDNTSVQQAGKLTIIEDKTRENLATWLRDPQAVKPGNKMVIHRLSEKEIEALVAYLLTLK